MEEIFAKCNEASAFLKLLANPNRLMVLCCLQDQRRNVTELTQMTGLPQAATSTQLSLLREAGLVDCEIKVLKSSPVCCLASLSLDERFSKK